MLAAPCEERSASFGKATRRRCSGAVTCCSNENEMEKMIRAGIFIGVDRTGDLRPLRDAAAGARRMHQWAIGQGMPDGTHATLITDAGGRKVTPDEIYDAVEG